jgi:hypothetical protein
MQGKNSFEMRVKNNSKSTFSSISIEVFSSSLIVCFSIKFSLLSIIKLGSEMRKKIKS